MEHRAERSRPKFRRVVTKHDENGKATVWIDGDATNHKFPDENISSTMMWSTTSTPTQILGDEDEGARVLGSAPPLGGSRFTMMEFQPGNEMHGLHRTDTVDYVICIAGEIDMFLDDGEFVTLRAGDVVIQRGTYHAWVNRGHEPCRLAVVLVPRTRSSRISCRAFDRELRVQRGTRIIELLVVLDSEVRNRGCRTSDANFGIGPLVDALPKRAGSISGLVSAR